MRIADDGGMLPTLPNRESNEKPNRNSGENSGDASPRAAMPAPSEPPVSVGSDELNDDDRYSNVACTD